MESSQPRSFYPGYSGLKAFEARATLDELLSLCLRNCANSFMVLALEGETAQAKGIGKGKTETSPSLERFILNLESLYSHVLDDWRDDTTKKLYDALDEEHWGTYFVFYHAIIELLHTKGQLSPSKIPRTLVE